VVVAGQGSRHICGPGDACFFTGLKQLFEALAPDLIEPHAPSAKPAFKVPFHRDVLLQLPIEGAVLNGECVVWKGISTFADQEDAEVICAQNYHQKTISHIKHPKEECVGECTLCAYEDLAVACDGCGKWACLPHSSFSSMEEAEKAEVGFFQCAACELLPSFPASAPIAASAAAVAAAASSVLAPAAAVAAAASSVLAPAAAVAAAAADTAAMDGHEMQIEEWGGLPWLMDPVEGHGFDGGPLGVVAALTRESSSLGGGGPRDEDDRK